MARKINQNGYLTLKFGNIKLIVKKSESFVFYATFIADEYKDLKIKKNDVVIDFGANIGDFTVKAGKKLNGTGKIIAIEPNHENVELLKENLKLNKINNVEILECAISDKDGYSYLSGNDVGASVDDTYSGNKVKTITIDTLLSQLGHIKNMVVKMDIEGAERYIFKNKEFIENTREIAIELHGKENIDEIPKILRYNNFKISKYNSKTEFKNTLKSILLHPYDFLMCEKKTNYIALKGAVETLRGKNPIPSINREDLMLIYASRIE
jgi:FkbM family methyltransferase